MYPVDHMFASNVYRTYQINSSIALAVALWPWFLSPSDSKQTCLSVTQINTCRQRREVKSGIEEV